MVKDNYVIDNVLRDIILQVILFNENEKNKNSKKIIEDIKGVCNTFLYNYLTDVDDIRFLDYDIKYNKGYYKVVPYNLITALWFSNIYPIKVDDVIKNEKYEINGGYYTFNNKNKLIYNKYE